MARVELIRVDPSILSAYDSRGATHGPRNGLQPLRSRVAGQMAPDAGAALLWLSDAVSEAGGDFRVTDGFRPPQEQAIARKKYLAWLAAGKPQTPDQGYNPALHKKALVLRPGRSFHQSGRSVDVDIASLSFDGTPENQQLDRLWAIAVPLGWRPIIRDPSESAKEAWHFDYMGPWAAVFDRIGYEQTAICAVLDVGLGNGLFDRLNERTLQAQLHRAGFDVGDVDGFLGRKSWAGIKAAGIDAGELGDMIREAQRLPNHSLQWTA